MSSADEDSLHREVVSSQRRKGRACDNCRRRKGDVIPGTQCKNCIAGQHKCTYVGTARKRYPYLARIKELEHQVSNLKKLLNKLHPGVDFTPALNGILGDNSLWLVNPAKAAVVEATPLPFPRPSLADVDNDDGKSSDDEAESQSALFERFKGMSIYGGGPPFLGKSSRFVFFKKVFDYKYEYAGYNSLDVGDPNQALEGLLSRRRTGYRENEPWLLPTLQLHQSPHLTFPEDDLLNSCVDLYFTCLNIHLPLLHRPTFQRQVMTGLHLVDEGFGSVLLLVCAVGARYSEDRRVLMDGTDSWHSAGWRWFCQVHSVRKIVPLRSPNLHDLQIYALMAFYLYGSVLNLPVWTLIGSGLRLAQDLGAHRRKRYSKPLTVEEELMKRAFWVLIGMDRSLCASLGRSCALQDEEFDVELPVECDDEYWLNDVLEPMFKQPEGKPSYVTGYNCCIKLRKIHAFALRTIYALNRAKAVYGRVDDDWEQKVVSEIDSALNEWADAVPSHLRWDPNREDINHLNQSALLWSAYYTTQINVHRPFIPSPRKRSSNTLPSLTICTNAARSCIHVLYAQLKRAKTVALAPYQSAVFTSAIVLLLNVWGAGRQIEGNPDMADVHKAMDMLKVLEPRWFSAGRFWDSLNDMINIGDPSHSQASLPQATKHHRDPMPGPYAEIWRESSEGDDRMADQSHLQSLSHPVNDPSVNASTSSSSSPPPPSSLAQSWPAYTSGVCTSTESASTRHSEMPIPSGSSWVTPGNVFVPSDDTSRMPAVPPTEPIPSFFSFEQSVEELFLHVGMDCASGFSLESTTLSAPEENENIQPPPNYQAPDSYRILCTPSATSRAPDDTSYGNDTLEFWSTAPSSFSWAEWDAYASNMSGRPDGVQNTEGQIDPISYLLPQ